MKTPSIYHVEKTAFERFQLVRCNDNFVICSDQNQEPLKEMKKQLEKRKIHEPKTSNNN